MYVFVALGRKHNQNTRPSNNPSHLNKYMGTSHGGGLPQLEQKHSVESRKQQCGHVGFIGSKLNIQLGIGSIEQEVGHMSPDVLLGTELSSLLGTLLGELLGTTLSSLLGTLLGELLGTTLGVSLGTKLGSLLGTWLGALLGTWLGALLGTTLGSLLGTKYVMQKSHLEHFS